MDAATAGVVGLALLAAGEVPNFLAGALPSFLTIGRFAADDHDRWKLRVGEILGGGMAILVAVGASLAAGSVLPLVMAAGVLVVMLAGYEWAIRHPHPEATGMNEQGAGNGSGGLRLVQP